MRNSNWPFIVGLALLALAFSWSCGDHNRSMIGRYLAPAEPLTEEDVIWGPMLADFESQTNFDHWNVTTDSNNTALDAREDSEADLFWVNTGGKNGIGMLKFTYTLKANYEHRFVNVGLGDNIYVGSNGLDLFLDASTNDGIHFWLGGTTNKLRLNICTRECYAGPLPARHEDTLYWQYYNWDFWGYNIEPDSSNWTEYFILFSDCYQKGFGAPLPFNRSHITKIVFQTLSEVNGETGYFMIDDVRLFQLK
jgi:hypothetical protein